MPVLETNTFFQYFYKYFVNSNPLDKNTSKDVKGNRELFFKRIFVKRRRMNNFMNVTISLLLSSLTINTRRSKLKSYKKTNQFRIAHITQTVKEHNRI